MWLLLADSAAPNGFVKIERGCLSAKPPKKKRKGVTHCMAVRQEGSCKEAQFKLVRAWQLRSALNHSGSAAGCNFAFVLYGA